MPGSKDVGINVKENRAAHPDWKPDQVVAVSLSQAREAGNPKVKPPPSSASPKRRKDSRRTPKKGRK